MDADAELDTLKPMCEGASLWSEGGQPVAYLPNFRFQTSAGEKMMDLALVPFAHSGYSTRLFFREIPLQGGLQWTQFTVCGQSWWTRSWNGVPSTLPWIQMLAAHLRSVP
jgi:hypothetical protein